MLGGERLVNGPTTSFVLPVYNGGAELEGTLDSILEQSDSDFELIVVDDGSTDGTPIVLRRFGVRDRRVRIIEQSNAGITHALINGCAHARGRYIARHDAGDRSHPNRLRLQRAALDADDGLTFVSCWTQYVGPASEPLFVSNGTGAAARPRQILDLSLEHCVIDGPSHHGNVVFRRDAYESVGGYRSEFFLGQDWDLWYRLAEVGTFQMIAQVLYFAAVTPGSISSLARDEQKRIGGITHQAVRARARGESDREFLATAATILPTRTRTRRALAAGHYFLGEALRRNGDPRAHDYFLRALRLWPLHPRAAIRLLQSFTRLRRMRRS